MDAAPASEPARSKDSRKRHVELVSVDEDVLDELVKVATSDAAPDEVTPPLGDSWNPRRVAWLRAYHRHRRSGLKGGEEETAAIRVDGRIVGAIRLHRSDSEAPESLEYGIWLARSWRGLGLGATVLRLIVRRAYELGALRLIARTTASNSPAIATLRRAGATLQQRGDGTVHAEIPLDGEHR